MGLRAAESILNEYVSTSLIPDVHYHGASIPVDPDLKGSLRSGKKLGTAEVTMYADTVLTTVDVVTPSTGTIKTSGTITDWSSGCLFKLPDTSLVILDSARQKIGVDGSVQWFWTLNEATPVQGMFDSGAEITLYGHPCTIRNIADNGLQVSTSTLLCPGDILMPMQLSQAGLIEGRGVKVIDVLSSTTVPGDTPYNTYTITVNESDKPSLLANLAYIKAACAYVSRRIPATDLSGAFFVDLVSSTTLGDKKEDIAISVNIHNSDGTVIKRYSNIEKNTAITIGSVSACDLATGVVEAGRVLPMIDGSLWCALSDDRLFCLGYDLVKTVDLGLRLQAVGIPGTKIIVETNLGITEYTVSESGVFIDLAGQQIDHVILRMLGHSSGVVILKNVPLDEDHSFISYSIVSHVAQTNQWGGSGLVLKPIVSPISGNNSIINGSTFIVGGGTFI